MRSKHLRLFRIACFAWLAASKHRASGYLRLDSYDDVRSKRQRNVLNTGSEY